jgi:hypothetical protein
MFVILRQTSEAACSAFAMHRLRCFFFLFFRLRRCWKVIHFAEHFFDICKLAAAYFDGLQKLESHSIKQDVLRFCIHVAAASDRSGGKCIHRVRDTFAEVIRSTEDDLLNDVVSHLLAATKSNECVVFARCMIPFYLMSRAPSRTAELRAVFLSSEFRLPLDKPCSLGSLLFITLVAAAHRSPSDILSACAPAVQLLRHVAADDGSNTRSVVGDDGDDRASNTPRFALPNIQAAELLSAMHACIAALSYFVHIAHPHATAKWLDGLADKSGVDRVCGHLEQSGAVVSLVDAAGSYARISGGKRFREDSGGEYITEKTVWDQVSVLALHDAGAAAAELFG